MRLAGAAERPPHPMAIVKSSATAAVSLRGAITYLELYRRAKTSPLADAISWLDQEA